MLVNTPTAIGNTLREARKKNGLKQSDLGLWQATVSSFKSNPENSTIETLLKFLTANTLGNRINSRISPTPL